MLFSVSFITDRAAKEMQADGQREMHCKSDIKHFCLTKKRPIWNNALQEKFPGDQLARQPK